MRTLNTATQKKIASAVELGIKADKAGIAALDLLIADGFDKVTDYIARSQTVPPSTRMNGQRLKRRLSWASLRLIRHCLRSPRSH